MDGVSVQVKPWRSDEPPTEAVIERLFREEGLRYDRWSNQGCSYHDAHIHAFDKVLYVIEGFITFSCPEVDREVTLGPGDRMELSAGVLHDASVGPDGVFCIEGRKKIS